MLIIMQHKQINRIKAVLADTNKTNKWLAEQLGKSETTISRWCTNEVQPSLETLAQIATLLNIDIKELLSSSKLL
jgi:putative transcriptional regulator